MNEIVLIYVTIKEKASMNLRGSKSGETREEKEGEKPCNYILNSKNRIKK